MKHNAFRVIEFGSGNKSVVFFFTILHSKIWLYRWPIKKLVQHGFTVVAYDYSGKLVLDGDIEKFITVTKEIEADVKKRIADYKEQAYKNFYCFGSSMGTILAIYCAANIKDLTKVIINTTYGSLAENVWTWRYLKRTKNKIIKNGLTMEKLETLLTEISPIPNAKKLKGKKVLLYLARHDEVLPFSQASKFKKALDEATVTYLYYENRSLKHIPSIIANLLRWKIYINFLTG
jgi:esterase/lipase